MSEWQPDPAGLAELHALLTDSLSPSNDTQRRVIQKLETFNTVPEFNSYLVHVLVRSPPTENEHVRAMAGLLLKGNVQHRFGSIPWESFDFIRPALLPGLQDPSAIVRQTTGNVVARLLVDQGLLFWPEALETLMQLLESPDQTIQQSALDTLAKVCEESSDQLTEPFAGVRPSDLMIPRFIAALGSPASTPKIKELALSCLNQFIPCGVQAFGAQTDPFISTVFASASAPNPKLRQEVCNAISLLLQFMSSSLLPNISDVCDFMLLSTRDRDVEVALEACEFWLRFAKDATLTEHLRPFLPKLAPVLLQVMRYSDENLLVLSLEEDDAAVPDKEQDIRPQHYSSKSRAVASTSTGQHKEDVEGDSDEEEEEEEDSTQEWNVRTCSAATIDVLAVTFGNGLLPAVLPSLQERLSSADWTVRESAILALGAIAEGCMNGITEHLPVLMQHLIATLSDPKALVRSITSWTLSRYAAWVAEPVGDRKETYFVPLMQGLLKMMLDKNKRVQEAGCSAFATLEEQAGPELIPFLQPIIENLIFAFQKYQQKNLYILYDAISTLAEAVGIALADEQILTPLMKPLTEKWQAIPDDSPALVPLLSCIGSVAAATQQAFMPYAAEVYNRGMRLSAGSFEAWSQHLQDPSAYEAPEKDLLICSLDLLASLAQGLQHDFARIHATCQTSVLTVMTLSMKHPEKDIRQSAFALLGDVTIAHFELVKPELDTLMPIIHHAIQHEPRDELSSVGNNAVWSTGEIIIRAGPESKVVPYIPTLVEQLTNIISTKKHFNYTLHDNAAVTLGRLGLVNPELVAPHLSTFAPSWCKIMAAVADSEEKDSAFQGFCRLIGTSPNAIVDVFVSFCNAVVGWTTPSIELNEMFRSILVGFKQMSPSQWSAWQAAMPQETVQRLQQRYGL